MTQRFIPGVEIIQDTIDGRKIKNTFKIEDNKLIEYQVEENRQIIIIREYFDDQMLGEAIFRDKKNKTWSVRVDD